ncbi:MAG: hypothetical protein ACLRRT_03280 [Ruthenibacterium lactatiformans]
MMLELTEEMRGACERLVETRGRGFWFRSTQTSAASFQRMRPRARPLWAVRHADVVAPTLSEGR